jgi:hypothetical protein
MEYEQQVELMTKKGGQGHSALGDNFTVSQVIISISHFNSKNSYLKFGCDRDKKKYVSN